MAKSVVTKVRGTNMFIGDPAKSPEEHQKALAKMQAPTPPETETDEAAQVACDAGVHRLARRRAEREALHSRLRSKTRLPATLRLVRPSRS
jgi:hypothetical protein